MSWSKVIASLKRHVLAIEAGEDFDKKSGLHHSAHIMCNAGFLTEYYKIYPEGDDRPVRYLKPRRIGLDIDGVLAEFEQHFLEYFGYLDHHALHWGDPLFRNNFEKIQHDEDFWMDIPPIIKSEDLPFEPEMYCTARPIAKEVTQAWLDRHRFPSRPLVSVGLDGSKIMALSGNIDLFVDDSYSNFVELNNAGVFTYLMTRGHNKKYDVGHRRIHSLNELV
jgi:hypothetical protein